jgi:hypothetical protein
MSTTEGHTFTCVQCVCAEAICQHMCAEVGLQETYLRAVATDIS